MISLPDHFIKCSNFLWYEKQCRIIPCLPLYTTYNCIDPCHTPPLDVFFFFQIEESKSLFNVSPFLLLSILVFLHCVFSKPGEACASMFYNASFQGAIMQKSSRKHTEQSMIMNHILYIIFLWRLNTV